MGTSSSLSAQRIYLDNAASTPLAAEAMDAMLPYLTTHTGNPSSTHREGRILRVAIEQARSDIAACLGVAPSCLYFSSGGTEANNAALHALLHCVDIQVLITSQLEHACVRLFLENASKKYKLRLRYVENKKDGTISIEDLQKKLEESQGKNVLLSLMHANNEIGNLTPWEEVATTLSPSVLFHSDTVQSMGKYDLTLQNHDYLHAAAASAHKFHGPKGVGFFYLHPSLSKHPLLLGGEQEQKMRAGTENVAGIVGMAKAFSIAHARLAERKQSIQLLKDNMIKQLKALPFPVTFNGSKAPTHHAYHVLNVSFPSYKDTQTLCQLLDIEGIAASAGSACASGALQRPHLLSYIDLPPDGGYVRFSFSHQNTQKEVEDTVKKIKDIMAP